MKKRFKITVSGIVNKSASLHPEFCFTVSSADKNEIRSIKDSTIKMLKIKKYEVKEGESWHDRK